MKFAKALAICSFGLLAVAANAQQSWLREYFVSVGAGASVTQGDLEGKKSNVVKSEESTETTYAPNLGVYFMPEVELGANMNQHTVSVDLSYADPTTNFGKGTDDGDETSTDIFKLGLNYRYNFFWPDPFQIFAGASYVFHYMSTENNAVLVTKDNTTKSDAVLMGNGFSINVGTFYYLSRHLTMEMHLRFKTMFYGSVGTDENSFSSLDHSYKQTAEELLLKFAYHF